MFTSAPLLLLALTSYVFGASELIQPDSVVIKPGETLTITCKVSGASITDSSNHFGTAWIRQPAGKALEWINLIYYNGEIRQKDSLKNKFVISRDTSSNSVTLRGQNLQTEDTAVYYCARVTRVAYAFDYWGKGTSVTVTSATLEAPKSLFPAVQCGSSDGLVTLGCVTRGLAIPDGLTFAWKDEGKNAVTKDFVQYPAVSESGGYSAVSQVRVKKSDWDASKTFFCEVTNSKGSKEVPVQKPPTPTIPASLLLTSPTQTELDNGTATFVCLASGFSPKTHAFKWTRDQQSLDNKVKPTIVSNEINNYTAISILELTTREWTGSSYPVKCEFLHKAQNLYKEASHESCGTSQPKVTIIPPSSKDILMKRSGDLVCKAEGEPGFSGIKWIVNGKEVAALPAPDVSSKTTISLSTPITYEEWKSGTKFTCEVHHSSFATGFHEEDYQRQNGNLKCPEVYLLAPPESSESNSVTLTCYVKDFSPKEVAVSWLVDDKQVDNLVGFKQSATTVIEKDSNFSAYSQLIVKTADWKNGSMFTCSVYHESIEDPVRHISRSVTYDSKSHTLVSLNLTVPQSCPPTGLY